MYITRNQRFNDTTHRHGSHKKDKRRARLADADWRKKYFKIIENNFKNTYNVINIINNIISIIVNINNIKLFSFFLLHMMRRPNSIIK